MKNKGSIIDLSANTEKLEHKGYPLRPENGFISKISCDSDKDSKMLEPGTKVKYSAIYLQKHRDNWQSCGREPLKTNYKKYYDSKKAMTGIVTSSNKTGSNVKWSDGSKSETISYHLEVI
jgi:hypothetical protein